jgi:glycosyltransferase involved in cell wall biosynthesis
MMVKDEANRITGALDDIIDLFDHVTIIDTGSTDDTPGILRQRYGIDVLRNTLEDWDCRCHGRVRNIGYGLNKSPWILTLDGDERAARQELESVIAMPEPNDPNLAGYFCAWNTHRGGGKVTDYKLPLVRGDRRREGLAHDNAQYAIRRDGK